MKTFILFLATLTIIMAAHAQDSHFQLSLDGDWLFKVDSARTGIASRWFDDSTSRGDWMRVQTPKYWEEYPGMATYDGWGWFARTFQFEKTGRPISIHFAGVDDDAVVWINGVQVGDHSGYTEPFALDITPALRTGQNSIVVLVKDNGGGGGIHKPITVVETRHLDGFLKGPFYGTPARKSAEWVRDAVIYSVYPRSFSPEGTFAGLEKRLPELKRLGATVLWLMPIHPVGEKNRKGTLGSPYAVRDYYGINPEFGTLADFKKLLAAAHAQGFKLIIDLVANHTSWDSKLITTHPEWFTKDAAGKIVPPNADWTDVADLDYSQQGLRTYMIAMMKWWVKDVGIDGFRCDVAEMVPTDFWEDARRELDRVKPVMMLAEGSIPELHRAAFDLTYAWNIYDALGPVMAGERPVALFDQVLQTEQFQFPVGSLKMRFTTNHDKNAWDMPAVTRYGTDGLLLATVFVNAIPGVPMIYNGEEVANDKRLNLFEKVGIDWTRPHVSGDLLTKLDRLRKDHFALSRGEMIRLASSGEDKVFSFIRSAGRDKILVVLNFAVDERTTTVQIPWEKVFPGRKELPLRDAFSGKTQRIAAGNPLVVPLTSRGYKVFVVEPETAKGKK